MPPDRPDPTPAAADELVGRDRPLAALAAVVADARGGQRGVVIVEGGAGIGKTSLVRAALADPSIVAIWASGDEAELDVDHGVIDQLVRVAPLSTEDRQHLHASVGVDPLHTGAAMVGLIDRLDLDPRRPLAVVLDDAQWADVTSLRALTFAARRLRRDPVVLVVVTRPDGIPHLPEGLVRLAEDEGTRLVLEPLGADDVRDLATARLGVTVPRPAAAKLRDHTGGSPLHLVTLLEELPLEVVLGPDDLPSPRAFSTLILSRLAGCAPGVEALVAAVAVLGGTTALPTAAAVAHLGDVVPALDEAVARGLLVATRPGRGGVGVDVAVSHPLVRAAVLGDLSVGRRAELHRRAAEVVGGAAGLRHRLLGSVGPDPELWADAMAMADVEARRGAHGSAAALLRHAAHVAPGEDDRQRALLGAVDRYLLAGRLHDATALRPAVEAASGSPRRSFVRGRLAYTAGPRRDARQHLAAAWDALVSSAGGEDRLRELDAVDRQLAGQVAAMRAINAVDRAAGEEAIRWSRFALDLAPEQAALASTAHMLAGAYALTGDLQRGLAELDRICAQAGAAGDPAVADAHSGRGLLRLWSHDLEGAASDLEQSLAAASRAGSFAARESARFYLAEVRYRQGRWDDAVLLAQVAASVVDDSDQDWLAALPHATAARPLAARGEEAARDHLHRAEAAAAAVGAGVGIVLAAASAIEVAACLGDQPQAVELADRLSGVGIDERLAPWRASAVEALVTESRLAEAGSLVTELCEAPTTPLVATDAARAAVVVAAATGDVARLDAAVEAGLALDPGAVGAYPRARLELAAGRAWRHRGERRRAVALLEQARSRFVALGAEPWVERTEREIAASGLRPARRRGHRGGELTPQEHAVAQLVARGLTNREVAGELVVSAKTVEHHLSRIYAKLGVRSRTELAHRLGRDPEG